ncbi:RNA polymerase III subunit C82 [Dimargaris verticillata]|uniref:DNA-directed RNA polymerase III subunit RPC3 n=1 Tax=Dimargaris verticillata TaxID=2761393 RepID=A0A9W8B9E9_9FUNG|nr:RNA polymerase III subunit C82 [Dimargaris verticillata]
MSLKVGSLLARKGRLPLPLIVQSTQLRPKQVREALVILLQQNLATWAEEVRKSGPTAFYTLNLPAVLLRLRVGEILKAVRDQFGADGLTLGQLFLLHGRLSLPMVRAKLNWKRLGKARQSTYMQTLQVMIRHRFLKAMTPGDAITRADRLIAEDAQAKAEHQIPPSVTELAKLRKKRRAQEEAEFQSDVLVGMKRKIADSDDTTSVKVRVGQFEMVEEVDETMHFAINFEQFNMYLRNRRLVALVKERTNKSGAAVVNAMVSLCEEKMRRCHEELSPPISVIQVTQRLPKGTNLADDMDVSMASLGLELDMPTTDAMSNANTQDLVRKFLDVLRFDQAGLIAKSDERSSGQYRVHFGNVQRALSDKVVLSYIQEKFGNQSCRMVRIINEKGRLDDKQIGKLALMPLKAVRRVVQELVAHGLLQLQEVPRTGDRIPSNCYYLVFNSYPLLNGTCLELHYKELFNVYSRLKYEQRIRTRLLAKAQLSKGEADEAVPLSTLEQKALSAYEKARDLLEVCLLRLDHQILVLRDIGQLTA